jgi:uncharacterized protein YbjT (DUF2867 family)
LTADKLLVMGATGNVGGELVRQLHEAGADVRAAVRDRERAELPASAEVVIADFDRPDTVLAAARGARRAFVLGGRRDMPGLFAALAAAGVEHVVMLTSRSVIGGVPGNAISDLWASSEDALQSSGLRFTILRPSGFMSNALRWLPELRRGDSVRAVFADVAIAAIDPHDLAAVAAAALTDRVPGSQALELSGPVALLPAQQLTILGSVLGRNLRLQPIVGEEARTELLRLFPPAFVDAQLRFFDAGEFDDARVVSTVPELLGRAPRTFEQWAAAHAAAFSG